MNPARFWTSFLLVLLLQSILDNHVALSPYVTLSLLPALMLCIPLRIAPISAMFIAAATGMASDLAGGGIIGLGALSCVAVAYVRNGIVRGVFGPEIFNRGEEISPRRQGPGKIALALALAQGVYLVAYIWADGSQFRSMGFNALRFLFSALLGFPVSMLATRALLTHESK